MHQHDTPDGRCTIFAECEEVTSIIGDWVSDPIYPFDTLNLVEVFTVVDNNLPDLTKCARCGSERNLHVCI